MKELKKLLEGVSDTYPDFVKGVLASAKGDKEKQGKLAEFIKGNSAATTSEIICYLDEIEGIA